MCNVTSIDYIDNISSNLKKHLNNSKLHSNEKGPLELKSVFLN